jgi:DEAD/DEAH box helicase domain-containing protein
MQSIGDTLQAIARQRGRGDALPLIAMRQLDGAPGERVSHLPINRDLAQAWPAMTGEPFRPHQAQALAALRKGDPVALRAASASVADSAYMLLYAALRDEPSATALIVAPDDTELLALHHRFEAINSNLPATLRLSATLAARGQRSDPYARVVVTTAEGLHGRLLRHHDRAWQQFWPTLRLIMLPDVQRHSGVAGAHLADLLLRSVRVIAAHGGAGAALLATLTEVVEPEAALTGLSGQPWRMINADDGPRESPLLAVWHAGASRLRDAADLSIALHRQGYQVHIAGGPLEAAAVAPVIGDAAGISVGPGTQPAQVLISAGYPGSTSALRRMLHSGYQAVVVVLGDLPHEQALARQVELLISGPPAAWPPPPANAYVTAQHVLCAASEQPLTAEEIDAWGAREVVERLAAHQRLVDLPDPEEAWKPGASAGDPYVDFSPLAASGAPLTARTEHGTQLGSFDPTGFERWTFPGAALPPGAGGMRVLERDDEQGSITLRIETSGRRTYPLRRCSAEVRETRDTRTLAGGKRLSWGRVVLGEEITGYRESSGGQAVTELALKTPLHARWAAPACWFDIHLERLVAGQLIGWCLAAALPLRVLADFTEVVPCYDEASGRLYLVDAQPGGSGLAAWIYAHAEQLLPLAYDIALACRTDPLLEPISRVDQDWLLTLLGRSEPLEIKPRVRSPEPEAQPLPPRVAPPTIQQPERRPPVLPERQPPVLPERQQPERLITPPERQPSERLAAPPEHQPPVLPERQPPVLPERQQSERLVSPPERQPSERLAAPPEHQPPVLPERQPPVLPERQQPERRPQAPANLPERRGSAQRRSQPPEQRPQATNGQLWTEPEAASPAPEERRPLGPAKREAEPPAEEARPDAAALIERLRRQRQQRESGQGRPDRPEPRPRAPFESTAPAEPRFKTGDRIFCLPYGDGTVRASRIDDGRELMTVHFPEHGELEIDPAVSLVRKLEDSAASEDDLL